MPTIKITEEELDLLIEAVAEKDFTLKYRGNADEFDERVVLLRLRHRFGKHKFHKEEE